MTSSPSLLSSIAAVAAVAASVTALLVSRDPSSPRVARAAATTQADPPRGVRVGCRSQSLADFPRAFSDRRNLVAGPLVLVGGATYTDAATVRRFGGNKFPLLVRAGHTVTLRVPPAAQRFAGLFYGPHSDGDADLGDAEHTMTFQACPPGKRQSTAPERVTFWSGFVMASRPGCVPLDVFVDGRRTPRRIGVELGRDCAMRPARPALRDCGSRAEGGRPPTAASRPGDVVLGPIALSGLQRVASRRGFEHYRSGRVHLIKAGAVVRAGLRATLVVGAGARQRAALTFATRRLLTVGDGHPSVTFQACAADEPAFSYEGPVGIVTGFAGGLVLDRRGCVPLEVRVAGRPTVRADVPFGVGRCPA
ncbi:MAG TPA: hypothetical protein VGO80_04845 [Solirubrobacteraceae bacterium]|jgi:hypothetical protein|nr:hypothetical protein [Solirubrobacteraceae bacterium]